MLTAFRRAVALRTEFPGPQWRDPDFPDIWRRVWAGHGSDEYGNCSWYFVTALFGGVIVFPGPHFQRDVLMPESGADPWIDRKYYSNLRYRHYP